MDSMHIGARDGKRLNSNTLGDNRLKEMYLKVRMQIQGDYKEQYRHTFLCLCVWNGVVLSLSDIPRTRTLTLNLMPSRGQDRAVTAE